MFSVPVCVASAVLQASLIELANPSGASVLCEKSNAPPGPALKFKNHLSSVEYPSLLLSETVALVPRCATCIAPLIIRFLFDNADCEPISAASSAALPMLALRELPDCSWHCHWSDYPFL